MADDSRSFTAHSFYAFLKEESRLMGIRCRSCGELSSEPRPMCRFCHSRDVEWRQFSGKGRLSTFTCISVVPEAMSRQGYGRDKPYCTGIVTLEEGPRVSALIHGVDGANPQDIPAGMAMALDLEDLDPDRPVLAFKPA